MKKLILMCVAAGIFSPAFAGDAEVKACLEKTVEVKAVLAGEKTDPALSGYVALLPELKEKMAKDMEDPYRCSLK